MDATVSAPVSRPDLSSGMNRANNQDWSFVAQGYSRDPEYYVYIYNVSRMEHLISRPPILREAKITARKEGERYALVTRLPQPIPYPKGNVDSSEIDLISQDARRFAMDIVNPDNLGLNQDAIITSVSAKGNNLGAKGVFWSINLPPTEEEVQAAYTRMEKNYRNLLNEAKTVETSNPKGLPETLTPEHHEAAEYFHEVTNWHSKPVHKENCPRCGEPANAGAKFHSLLGGGFCIDGISGWKAVVAAGIKTRAQAYDATDDESFAPRRPKTVEESQDQQ